MVLTVQHDAEAGLCLRNSFLPKMAESDEERRFYEERRTGTRSLRDTVEPRFCGSNIVRIKHALEVPQSAFEQPVMVRAIWGQQCLNCFSSLSLLRTYLAA